MYRLAIVSSLTLFSGVITTTQAQDVKKTTKTKKGWSKKAKYTAIGAGVGTATGVAVGKNDSKSGVIGGVVGAGAGYIYGKKKDKKEGRRKRY